MLGKQRADPNGDRPVKSSAYQVTVRGGVPSDISRRISVAHAAAILKRLEAESALLGQHSIQPATPVAEQLFTQLRE